MQALYHSQRLSYSTLRGQPDVVPISPAQCGGLIEASLAMSSAASMMSISPAQCGGLIEARRLADSRFAAGRDFPRAMRGPH